MFPLILVDEVHCAAADKYVGIVGKLNPEYLIGFSGTPARKDNRYLLVDNVVGPVFHEMKTKRERPTIKLTKTSYEKTYKGNVVWARIVSAMENDKKRLKLIADQALRDVADGHMILIPFAQVKPTKELIRIINEKAGKRIAYEFSGGLKKTERDDYIQKAREYKIKILVGTAKVLSVGINIPRASMLYETILSSNVPAATQRMARVLTPMENKPAPVIRYFLDDFTIRRNCLRNEYFNCLKPVFKPIISDVDNELLKEYFSGGTRSRVPRYEL
jgi:superfamily II DNA or RNA helicase